MSNANLFSCNISFKTILFHGPIQIRYVGHYCLVRVKVMIVFLVN